VKRIVDGRQQMALPHDGIACFQRGYTENLAHLVYLAATTAEAAGGAFNSGDSRVMSARHVAEVIIDELGGALELVGVPAPLCRGSFPLAEKSNLVLDLSKARQLLGYADVVDVEAATRLTARWLFENQAFAPGINPRFGGSLAYEEEDRILTAWRRSMDAFDIAVP
jgi:nucleoside-diphosphate-sugar epimerase